MKTYKIVLGLGSPLITPLQADTIFGHLCWALRYMSGERRLTDFLEQMQTDPPLLLSDGFPEAYLPRPVVPPLTIGQKNSLEELFSKHVGTGALLFNAAMKRLRKVPYVHCDTFSEVVDGFSDVTLYEQVIRGERCARDFAPKGELCADEGESCLAVGENGRPACRKPALAVSEIVAHNTINRLTDTTGAGGGFYQQEETFYAPDRQFAVYLRCDDAILDEVKNVFSCVEQGGYGKDKSTGKGHIKIAKWEPASLPESDQPNAVMSLSNMIPTPEDPTDARYDLITKFGKLGGDWAKSAYPGGKLVPFKTPLLMMRAGAVFAWNKDRPKRAYLGCLMDGVHRHKPVRHYAYGFPLYLNVKA